MGKGEEGEGEKDKNRGMSSTVCIALVFLSLDVTLCDLCDSITYDSCPSLMVQFMAHQAASAATGID